MKRLHRFLPALQVSAYRALLEMLFLQVIITLFYPAIFGNGFLPNHFQTMSPIEERSVKATMLKVLYYLLFSGVSALWIALRWRRRTRQALLALAVALGILCRSWFTYRIHSQSVALKQRTWSVPTVFIFSTDSLEYAYQPD